jgi:putative ABC transport system permease protein
VFDLIVSVLTQGLIYAPMVLGVYITYQILDFPDLSVDGTFPLGAAVCSVLIVAGVNPILACIFAVLAGALAGVITGVLHVYFNISNLLSGILVMTGLYSINLRIMGKANIPLLSVDTIFSSNMPKIIVVLLVVIVMKLLLDLYMKTYAGMSLLAVGSNQQLVTSLGQNVGTVKIVGLSISNGLTALSGAMWCQYSRYADITMGTGTVVIGLASVILGISIFKKSTLISNSLAVIIGSILYKIAIAIALGLGLAANDMKLITAVIFIIILILQNPERNAKFKRMMTKERG